MPAVSTPYTSYSIIMGVPRIPSRSIAPKKTRIICSRPHREDEKRQTDKGEAVTEDTKRAKRAKRREEEKGTKVRRGFVREGAGLLVYGALSRVSSLSLHSANYVSGRKERRKSMVHAVVEENGKKTNKATATQHTSQAWRTRKEETKKATGDEQGIPWLPSWYSSFFFFSFWFLNRCGVDVQ